MKKSKFLMSKYLILSLIISFTIFLTGCSENLRIDKASMVSCITVKNYEYTFYLLTEEENVVSVKANDFENSIKEVKSEGLPNINLSRLEIVIFDENINHKYIVKDIESIKNNYSISPTTIIAISNDKIFKKISDNDKKIDDYIERINIFNKKDYKTSENILEFYNKKSSKGVNLSYIDEKGEIDKINIRNY